MPFGYGAHPYLTAGEDRTDDVMVTVPADQYLVVDERLLPASIAAVAGTDCDLRERSTLGPRVLDTAFTSVRREADGVWCVRLEHGDRFAELWAGQGFDWLQIYTGADARDIGIAVEPMTCGPDAFNPGPTHDGMRVLRPGEEFRGAWGIRGR